MVARSVARTRRAEPTAGQIGQAGQSAPALQSPVAIRARELLGELATQDAKTGLDGRRLIEIAVAGLRRLLVLEYRAAQIALPRVELALMTVLLHFLAEVRIGLCGEP